MVEPVTLDGVDDALVGDNPDVVLVAVPGEVASDQPEEEPREVDEEDNPPERRADPRSCYDEPGEGRDGDGGVDEVENEPRPEVDPVPAGEEQDVFTALEVEWQVQCGSLQRGSRVRSVPGTA